MGRIPRAAKWVVGALGAWSALLIGMALRRSGTRFTAFGIDGVVAARAPVRANEVWEPRWLIPPDPAIAADPDGLSDEETPVPNAAAPSWPDPTPSPPSWPSFPGHTIDLDRHAALPAAPGDDGADWQELVREAERLSAMDSVRLAAEAAEAAEAEVQSYEAEAFRLSSEILASREAMAERMLPFPGLALRPDPAAGSPVAAEAEAASSPRTIDVNLIAERFAPGGMAALTVTLRLPGSMSRGKWQGEGRFADGAEPVLVLLQLRGFVLLSEPPGPIALDPTRDSAPVAFELQIEEADSRWIHILLTQAGRSCGEVSIEDFSPWSGDAPMQRDRRGTVRRVAEADLMLVMRSDDDRVEVCSPRDRACLDHVGMPGFTYPDAPFRAVIASRLKALYDPRSNAAETARELKILGSDLGDCLPADLRAILRRPDIRTVMLRHEDDFDFPLELVYLDGDGEDGFFLGDRAAVCRWYLGVTNLPDVVEKPVGRAALLKGSAAASSTDEAMLQRMFPGRSASFASKGDALRLFQSRDYDLIHFAGHCQQSDRGEGGLEMADGSFLRFAEIGRLKEERVFADAEPFVMLNACASLQPYPGLTRKGSFAHRFVTSRACAVVGTLWPVEDAVASEFAAAFYAELAGKPIGRALVDAKAALLAAPLGDAEITRLLARQVAVRSYCIFANPDLRMAQPRLA